ncbi:MAG: hypothetical protein COT00_04545 [Candidatus Omnitrophica bacterium CG07_land_8_20_14_0_80_50_8]|nr:MAG: hypothetical protein COT00_04545 [Candidatus Omnitrophica bacterium CG07_land_8_20_14_0_80_50_8]
MSIVAMNGNKKMNKVIDQLKKNAERSLDDAKENIVEAATQVDKRVHKNAWAYIGGAALCALIAGFITGRLTKK